MCVTSRPKRPATVAPQARQPRLQHSPVVDGIAGARHHQRDHAFQRQAIAHSEKLAAEARHRLADQLAGDLKLSQVTGADSCLLLISSRLPRPHLPWRK